MAKVHITAAKERAPAYHIDPACGFSRRILKGRIVEIAELDFDFYRYSVTPCRHCCKLISCRTCGGRWSDPIHNIMYDGNPKYHRPTGTTLYDKQGRLL